LPTIEENRGWANNAGWANHGEEWSEGFGDTYQLWHGFLLPRIGGCLPAGCVLEIAPGHGRCTEYLRLLADRLIIVDLVPECIGACRHRFATDRHIEFHVNDGRTLPMVADESIDFAFSWDSLVHVELDVLSSYLRELRRTLRPGGGAFLHHSNLGEYVDASGQSLLSADHWRAKSVTARQVREICREIGLECRVQELIPWGADQYIDAFSFLRRPLANEPLVETVIKENSSFLAEASNLSQLRALYGRERLTEGRKGRQMAGSATPMASAMHADGLPLRYRLIDRIHARLKSRFDRLAWIRRAVERWLDP
jgi:ubiquinone/menaquinone biosynthesis C-methylase UbiE